MKPLEYPEEVKGILSFDFDGTLFLPENEVSLEPIFYETIAGLRDEGWLWAINTGRSLLYMLEGFQQGGFPFAPDFLVAREREIYTAGDQFGRWHRVEEWHAHYMRDMAHFMEESAEFIEMMKRYIEDETAAQWIEEEGDPAGIIASSEDEMLGIAAFVEQERQSYGLVGVLRNSIYMRFTHKDYHKGSSLQELARRVGVPVEQVFAIGDGHNDIDKLHPEVAGMIACVSNSQEEVKEYVRGHGGYVAEGHGSLGSVEALRHYLGCEDKLLHRPL
ncbi:HAD family hydrolase [Rubritalea tangerina]|uniref:HAD family hydrolase n=1 Tax=Rubritalea tangerina TaxID=430798 RepID=A0ABW4ZBG0_9BACT